MKKVWTSSICILLMGGFFASVVQAGGPFPKPPPQWAGPQWVAWCDSDESNDEGSDTFCHDGDLFEVTWKCVALETGVDAEFAIWTLTPYWDMYVVEGTPFETAPVCAGEGYYGATIKTEYDCKDAEKGPNKEPGNGNNPNGQEPDTQASLEIKKIGSCI